MFKKRFIKCLSVSMAALFVYMPLHIFLSQWLSNLTGGLGAWKLWKDFFTILLTILFIGTVFSLRKHTKLYKYLVGLTALYGLIHLILLLVTSQRADTGLLASVYNLRIFAYAICGYSLVLLLPRTNYVRKFVKILLIVSTIVCLIALLQWLLPKDLMAHFGYSIERGAKPNFFIDDKPDLPRVFSTLRDPNSLGAFLILPIILLGQRLTKVWKTKKRIGLSGLLGLHILILFLTFSRSALLATAIAGAVVVVLQNYEFIRKNRKKVMTILGFFLILSTVLVVLSRDQYVVQNLVFHSDENTQQIGSSSLHFIQIKKGLDGIAEQPLGYGPGTAGLVSIHNGNGGLITENYFVQIGYEVGIEGLVLLLLLMYIIIKNVWKNKQKEMACAVIAGFVGLTFMNLLLHTWALEGAASTWFILAGLLLPRKDGE